MVIPDLSVHIVQRGHDRSDCFFEESDYHAYLGYLGKFAAEFGCTVHAFCLMTNHVHLLVTPRSPDSCALMMKNIGQRHVQRINSRLDRSGTLWEGRFYSCPVPGERYVLTCYRYIELNPQRALMVGHPSAYPWSSYHQNVCGDPCGLLTPHPVYLALAEHAEIRGAAYRALCDEPIEAEALDRIRAATRGGYSVGTARPKRGRPPIGKIGSVPI